MAQCGQPFHDLLSNTDIQFIIEECHTFYNNLSDKYI